MLDTDEFPIPMEPGGDSSSSTTYGSVKYSPIPEISESISMIRSTIQLPERHKQRKSTFVAVAAMFCMILLLLLLLWGKVGTHTSIYFSQDSWYSSSVWIHPCIK